MAKVDLDILLKRLSLRVCYVFQFDRIPQLISGEKRDTKPTPIR